MRYSIRPDGTNGVPEASETEDELVALADESDEPFTPEIVLFVDGSEESEQARRLLIAAGQEFRTLEASGPRIPALVFGGIVVEKLSGVRDMLGALNVFESTFLRRQAVPTGEPPTPTSSDPHRDARHGPRA